MYSIVPAKDHEYPNQQIRAELQLRSGRDKTMKFEPSPLAIEDKIRRRLAKRFRTRLEKRRLDIKGVPAEFDFVSKDEQIVGQIKSSKPRREGKLKGKVRKQTQFGDFSRDCLLLAAKKNATTRLFVLTNTEVCAQFRESPWGKAAEVLGVQIRRERI